MTQRRISLAALLAAAIAGAVADTALRGGPAAPAAPLPPPVSTATLIRTDLKSTVLTGGTLGYRPAPPIVNQLSGTYTQLPRVGTTIRPGGTLYRVDNIPVVLMRGATPGWRAFEAGMSDGPDVRELQANLIALGDAAGLLTAPTGHYDWLTAVAVERWQRSEHEPVTGAIPFGEIVFLRTDPRVGTESTTAGQAATPGGQPYQVTGTRRAVVVTLNPNLPPTRSGEDVAIILPSGASVPGTITATAPLPGAPNASAAITITPARSSRTGTATGVAVQVALTTSAVHGALTAPVAALLALAGGGYGLEVVEPSGAHRLVGVQTGAFAGSQVQVSGAGIGVGMKVVVAQ
jgi:peptidoglycan hydrolase-like protein with peptidoglycan-binding domain